MTKQNKQRNLERVVSKRNKERFVLTCTQFAISHISLCWNHSCTADRIKTIRLPSQCWQVGVVWHCCCCNMKIEGGRQIDCKLAFFQALPIECFIRITWFSKLTFISNSICSICREDPQDYWNWKCFVGHCSALLFSLPTNWLWCFHTDGTLSTTPRGNRENHHHLHQVHSPKMPLFCSK